MPPTLYDGPPPTGKLGPTGLPKMQARQHKEDRPASPVIVFGGIAVIIALGGYLYLRNSASTAPAAPGARGALDSVKQYLQLPDAVRQRLGMKPKEDINKSGKKSRAIHAGAKNQPPEPAVQEAVQEAPFDPYTDTTLLLKNGERITGKLVRETPEQVTLHWEYGNATFKSSELVQVIHPLAKTAKPPGKAAFRPGDALEITLSNGERLTGELVQELPDEWIFRFDFGEVNFKKTEVIQIQPAASLGGT